MKYDLKQPCANCPFRTDIPPFLTPGRAKDILDTLTRQQGTFTCHKTAHSLVGKGGQEQHCAGAMILLEKIGRPNQMMRIAERLRMYDHRQLNMDAPVFDSPADMLAAMKGGR